jgi:diguanylate cyclase (GGDEF)-like protein
LAGDEFLTFIASSIKRSLREIDIAIRYGGDEFIILLKEITTREEIITISNRIYKALERPLHYEKHDHVVKISIGVALYPEEAITLTDLIKKADGAMYHAKINKIQLCFSEDLES